VTGIATGDEHACALKVDDFYCWGRNNRGQLGDGTTVNSSVPVEVDFDPLSEDFILVLDIGVDDVPALVRLPLGGEVDVSIDWGDGGTNTCPATASGSVDCTYGVADEYTITISKGEVEADELMAADATVWLESFGDNNWPGVSYVTAVESFGELGTTSLRRALSGAVNNVLMPKALPSTVTNLDQMFRAAVAFNQDIGGWDTSSVNNMSRMFDGAAAFNQNIGGWDTSSVTNMSQMFEQAASFNNGCASEATGCPLDWDTGSVTNMGQMFAEAASFNNGCALGETTCPLTWNTGNVTAMQSMFRAAVAFNQNIGEWDTSNVTNMASMFDEAASFNNGCASGETGCPLNWNTGNVTSMSTMFKDAKAFNQDLSGWVVSNVGLEPDCAPLDFDTGADAWQLPNSRPVWGPCPAP
jgi:surface protein